MIFLEHKHLYRQTYNKAPNPGPNFMIPFGKAKVVRPGTDLTVVTYGAMVQRSLWAAKEAEEQLGISAEVIDLRSLSPVDWETIGASVQKTNRVIVAYEDSLSWGYGAEIAARIAEELLRLARRAGDAGRVDRHVRRPTRPSSRTRSCRRSTISVGRSWRWPRSRSLVPDGRHRHRNRGPSIAGPRRLIGSRRSCRSVSERIGWC